MQESCKPLTLTREVAAAKSCAFKIESQDFEILLEGSLAALHPSTALWILAPLNQNQPLAKGQPQPAPNWHRACSPISISLICTVTISLAD